MLCDYRELPVVEVWRPVACACGVAMVAGCSVAG